MLRNQILTKQPNNKILLKLGCMLKGIILLIIFVPGLIWFYSMKNPEEIQLKHSISPNKNNEIEIVKIAEFPDPIIWINYADQSIMKTNIPHDVSVEWKSEYVAYVTLKRTGRELEIVIVEFEED